MLTYWFNTVREKNNNEIRKLLTDALQRSDLNYVVAENRQLFDEQHKSSEDKNEVSNDEAEEGAGDQSFPEPKQAIQSPKCMLFESQEKKSLEHKLQTQTKEDSHVPAEGKLSHENKEVERQSSSAGEELDTLQTNSSSKAKEGEFAKGEE